MLSEVVEALLQPPQRVDESPTAAPAQLSPETRAYLEAQQLFAPAPRDLDGLGEATSPASSLMDATPASAPIGEETPASSLVDHRFGEETPASSRRALALAVTIQ